MGEDLLFSVSAVLPIVLLCAVGYFIKRIGLCPKPVAVGANKLVFRVFLPVMLFLNIYKIEDFAEVGFAYILYAILATVAVFLLGIPTVIAFAKGKQRGALLQCFFRSNYALIGIPLAMSLYGEAGGATAALLSAFSIPTYNILAVVSLSIFSEESGKRPSVKKILLGIVKNPLIDAIALGGIALFIRFLFTRGGISFRLSEITPVYSALEQLAAVATPLALVSLGAQFEFSAVSGRKREILIGTLARNLIVPALGLSCAALLVPGLGGAHYATLIALFATPVAVSSVPMAQEMGSDAALAGDLVVFTTVISGFTTFLFVFALKSLGLL